MISDDTIKKTICKNITKYRKLAGLNQKEFAAKLGASPSRVSSWETGANSTDIDTLFKICEILNVSINDMFEIYPDANVMLSYLEQEHIKRYRFISKYSPDGAKTIDMILNQEYIIAEQLKEKSARIKELESATAAIVEPQPEQPSVEEAEAEYIKSRSNSVKKTASSALSTTKGTALGNRASGA